MNLSGLPSRRGVLLAASLVLRIKLPSVAVGDI
jgi:hypothetical protein